MATTEDVAIRLSAALLKPLEQVGELLAGEIDRLKSRVDLHKDGIEQAHEKIDRGAIPGTRPDHIPHEHIRRKL